MTHHPAEETLHRLVDAELSPGELAIAERHVSDCDACRATVQKLERLRRAANAMPRSVAPPPEAWEAILMRLPSSLRVLPEAESTGERLISRSRGWRWVAAAALVLIVVVGLSAPVYRARQFVPAGDVARDGRGSPSEAGTSTVSGGAPEAGMVEQLMRELEAGRHVLDPQTIAVVEQNLRAIDAAVAATQQALADDPNNVHLETMLTRTRRQQMEFIRSTLALASVQ